MEPRSTSRWATAGVGALALALASPSWAFYRPALEFRRHAVAADNTDASRAGDQVHRVVGDVHHLPFASGSVDLVLLSEVLEHLHDPALALRTLLHARFGPRGHVFQSAL